MTGMIHSRFELSFPLISPDRKYRDWTPEPERDPSYQWLLLLQRICPAPFSTLHLNGSAASLPSPPIELQSWHSKKKQPRIRNRGRRLSIKSRKQERHSKLD